MYSGGDVLFHLQRLAGGADGLVGHDVRQLGEVRVLTGDDLRALVHARYVEQLVDERGHTPALALHHLQALAVVVHGLCILPRVLALGEDYGHGCAQLMGGVGGKALFAVKAALQPVKHAVEGGGEAVYLVPAPAQADACGEVVAVVYGVHGVRDLAYGLEGMPGDEPADHGRDDNQHGQENQGQYGDDPGGGEVIFSAGDAAQPDAARVRLDQEVVDQERGAVNRHLAHLAVVEFFLAVKVVCARAAEKLSIGGVGLDVDVVAVEVQLIQVEEASVEFDVVNLIVYHVQQSALRRVGDDAAAGDEDDAEHQYDDQHHHEREVDGHARLDREKLHFSSRRTQPAPRTVWMSLVSKGASTLRRR